MVDALRAALRFLPAVRPSVGGTGGVCLRVPRARLHSAPEQSTLLALKIHPQIVNCEKGQEGGGTGIVRFARAVLAYVGAGFSAVTANQLVGPSILHAKELGSTVGENHMIATSEARGMWQRTAGSRHMMQEDGTRSPKFAHCPLPHIVSKSQADVCHAGGHSAYWNSSWGSVDGNKLDTQWQFSPSTHRDYRSKISGLEESLNSRFSKPTGLQALAAESNYCMKSSAGLIGSTVSDYNTAAELELDWQLIVNPPHKSGLAASVCESKICEEDEEVTFEETVVSCDKQDNPAEIRQVNTCQVGTSDIMTKTFKEMAPQGSHHGARPENQPEMAPKEGSVFPETSEQLDKSSRLSMKKSHALRKADKDALVALAAKKKM